MDESLDINLDEIIQQGDATETAENTEPDADATETASADGQTAGETGNAESEDKESSAESSAADSDASKDDEPFITIRYNHRAEAMSREDAIRYAQIGRRMEKIKDQLDYVAAQKDTDVDALVKALVDQEEAEYRDSLDDAFDDKTVDDLMELHRSKAKGKYDAFKTAAESEEQEHQNKIEERLAEEYIDLKKSVPDAVDFADLPPQVINASINDGVPLKYAYAYYNSTKAAKTAETNTAAQAAKNASTGSLGGEAASDNTSENAFLKGLFGT